MVSKPKACKYGCGTIITWNEGGRFFQGPDMQKHDCRDWPGVGNQGLGTGQSYNNIAPNQVQNAPPAMAGPQFPNGNNNLEEIRFKKQWDNYFKDIPAIVANTAAIASAIENLNGLLAEQLTAIKSLEDALTVQQMKLNGGKVDDPS